MAANDGGTSCRLAVLFPGCDNALMIRSNFRVSYLVAIVLAAAGLHAPAAFAAPDPDRPNIVLIVADDLGWAELGSYGQTIIRTPHLDAIAAEGIRFTDFYAGAPVCAPSRCVLMTGLHSGHTFVRDNKENGGWGPDQPEGQLALPAETPTIARMLKSRGYTTGAIGKWGLGGPGSTGAPNQQGFDFFYGYLCQRVAHNLYPTHLWRNDSREDLPGNTWGNLTGETYSHDRMADEMLDFVRQHDDTPFFLYLPFHIPHLALQAPQSDIDSYTAAWEGVHEDPPYEGGKGYLPHPTPRACYAAMVTRMDRDIGRLTALLKERGLDENTVIFFTSDNGATYDIGGAASDFFNSGGGLRGAKGSMYEGGIRVPLIARWPGRIKPGTTTDALGAFQDFIPTLGAIAGAEVPSTDGVNLLPTLLSERSPAADARPALYFEFPGYGGQRAVRMGPWKAVHRNIRKKNTAIQLFNLDEDPGETTDIANEHPEVMKAIRAFMDESRRPSTEFPLPMLDEISREQQRGSHNDDDGTDPGNP